MLHENAHKEPLYIYVNDRFDANFVTVQRKQINLAYSRESYFSASILKQTYCLENVDNTLKVLPITHTYLSWYNYDRYDKYQL